MRPLPPIAKLRTRIAIMAAAAVVVILAGSPAIAQSTEPVPETPGTPFRASWDYLDYQGHSQNWAIAQDLRGTMYFGNGNGVLQYDGTRWRTLPVSNNSIVRSLAVDRSGTVYVGAVGELGLIRADETGTARYVSLLDQLEAEDREFGDVWRTWASDEGIYFWPSGKLFRWRDGHFRTWTIDSKRGPFLIGDKLYNNQPGVGLTVLGTDDLFHPVAGGEFLADAGVIMLPHDDGGILAGSRDGELWILSPAGGTSTADLTLQAIRFETTADEILARHRLYSGVRLPDGAYAFGTMTGGSVVIDADGELTHRFTKGKGLLDDSVWSLFVDRDQGLWHGLNRGIVRFELGTPITTFDQATGLDGTVEALHRMADSLYIATSLGLYRMRTGRIEAVASRGAPFWCLLAHQIRDDDARLLVGGTNGVFELRGRQLEEVVATRNAFVLHPSTSRPEMVYVGEMGGIRILELRGGRWTDAGKLEGVDKEIRSIVEDSDGHLWLGTPFDGVLRVTLAPAPETRVASVEVFGVDHGLTSVRNLKVLPHGDKVLFASTGGLFHFDPKTATFAPSTVLGEGFGLAGDSVLRWSPDSQGKIWLGLFAGSQAIAVPRPDGSYELDRDSLVRLEDHSIHAILPEPDVTWLGGVQGLFRFDHAGLAGPDVSPARSMPFSALLRRVTIAQPHGRMLFGGDQVPAWTPPVLPASESSLRFEYALPRFDGSEDNLYRSRLVGLERDWNDWSDETYRDFTALREGRYRFEVQGRDTYHRSSEIAAFDVRVLPPWHRTWWAYGLYLLALTSLTWALLSWLLRRARLEMEVRRLAEANALMRQTEEERQLFVHQLENKNTEMERFIYTVSHDLKSPLISIRGFLGLLQSDISEGDHDRIRHDMERIDMAAGKMAHLVDDLLELSKVGRMTHEPQDIALDDLAREAADQVAGLIAEREVEVVIAPDLPPVTGDRDRLLAMLQNLIENSVKYMGDQPSPRIEIDYRPRGDDTVYQVRDNGIGIDPRYREKIFGLFERLGTDTEGTGVGLALAKRIVEVHGGRIWVESEGEGKGSTFHFTLPGRPAEAPAPQPGSDDVKGR